MSSIQPLLDAAGRRRSPATTPGFRAGIAPRNKGQRYPADPPIVDEIVAVMRQANQDRHGRRINALIVVLWRAGLRINEALSLTETDLDRVAVQFWSGTARTTAGARSAWTPGDGQRSSHGSLTDCSSRSGRCSA
jgi:integrase